MSNIFLLQIVNIVLLIFAIALPVWLVFKINSIDRNLKEILKKME